MNTPKAFANFSPGFEEREPWDYHIKSALTLKGFANRLTLSGFGPSIGTLPRVLVPRTLG